MDVRCEPEASAHGWSPDRTKICSVFDGTHSDGQFEGTANKKSSRLPKLCARLPCWL